ncbi:MAG: hypothetical protein GY729_09385 [Desulfobacteraceae bacterium]|nr:hypothetical protein [Desulfobacteraceae bacterium]
MKISDASLTFSSSSHLEQMDEYLREKTESQMSRQTRSPTVNLSALRRGDEPQPMQILMDRVSLSTVQAQAYQSTYSADIASHSIVRSSDSEETIEYDQQYAVEKLVESVTGAQTMITDFSVRPNPFEDTDELNRRNSLLQEDIASTVQKSEQGWMMSVKETDIHFESEQMLFNSSGKVVTEDGREIEFSLEMALNRSFYSETQKETLIQVWQERVNLTDPLVINFDGSAPTLTDATFEFDLDNDGSTENISFVSQGSGFLALDRNNDNVINNGSELFGPGTGNGFMELAAFDEDQNNWIDENDAVFEKLSVWTKDAAGNDKLISLKEAGVGAIALDHAMTSFKMAGDDNELKGQMRRSGVFLFENGNVGSVQQVDLAARRGEDEDLRIFPNQFDQNELPENLEDLQSGMTIIPAQMQPVPEVKDVSNPLEELIKRIEKLKAELENLYKAMDPNYGTSKVGKGMTSLKRSSYNLYESLGTKPSPFLFGGQKPLRTI